MEEITDEKYKDLWKIEVLYKTFQDFFPEDRLDIPYKIEDIKRDLDADIVNYTLRFCTYYPEITLTNDYGKTHTIYDVYVRRGIYYHRHERTSDFSTPYQSLGRTSFTDAEIISGYIHSHVSSNDMLSMKSFCTGFDSTPINVAAKNLEAALNDIDEDTPETRRQLELLTLTYIVEAERTLSVESNAGRPYISFSTVGTNVTTEQPVSISCNCYTKLYELTNNSNTLDKIYRFIEYYMSLGLDKWYFDGVNWQLDCTDEEFITRLSFIAANNKTARLPSSLFIPSYEYKGQFYRNSVSGYENYQYVGQSVNWRFKGKTLYMQVHNSNEIYKSEKVEILSVGLLNAIYTFLIEYKNGIEANRKLCKDNFYSKSYKIKTQLLKTL